MMRGRWAAAEGERQAAAERGRQAAIERGRINRGGGHEVAAERLGSGDSGRLEAAERARQAAVERARLAERAIGHAASHPQMDSRRWMGLRVPDGKRRPLHHYEMLW